MPEMPDELLFDLSRIDAKMCAAEEDFQPYLKKIHPANQRSAVNLLHYLALRSLDIRDLQDKLHARGLSSMASSESHIRGQLLAICQLLGREHTETAGIFDYYSARQSLAEKASVLFGKQPGSPDPSIMVTLDSALADDYANVKNLLQSGMNIARINCAHDNESTWFRMIQHIKRASRITGNNCKIYMDLAGPKIRTVIRDKGKMELHEGQHVFLTDEEHMTGEKNEIGCTVPGIAAQLRAGEAVLFDDGLIEARAEKIEGERVKLLVLRVSSKKHMIKSEKGINFPESSLSLPALTAFDRSCLPFISKHADMVGYSFVRNTKDLLLLQELIEKNDKLSVVIKIETPEAVKNLPDLLFCGMQRENPGVMIARGDLAVEIGFERMSEIQEEIVWICEAAHVPVIWATQVLDNLNKSGLATRSEVTDAAYAAMADCVMINKGDFIIRTLETLRDILIRSGGHHSKKRFIFRPLSIATRFMTK